MAVSYKLFDTKAKEVGKISLADEVFGVEYNEALIHEVVVAQRANARQGTHSALTRSEVKGGAKKPHRQKGTGQARQGSTVGPHQTGGGVAFAKKPRDYSKKVNKQAKRVATYSALSQKARQDEIVFLDKLTVKEGKTKEAQKILDAFKIDRSLLVVVNDSKEVDLVRRSLNNIPTVTIIDAKLINVYDIVANNKIMMTEAAARTIEEVAR